ncbi:MAG: hypothetical protein L7H04_05885 [Vulcanisaeta sp.]|nr:hypothetical protein [Vulcanisaeta sp.]
MGSIDNISLTEQESCIHYVQSIDENGKEVEVCKEFLEVFIPRDANGNPLDYVLIYVSTKKEGDDGKVVIDRKEIAKLPRQMALVKDPFYEEEYYVAIIDGKLRIKNTDFREFIDEVTNIRKYYVIKNEQYMEKIKELFPEITYPISPGLTDDGFVDPYGVVDTTDYGPESLITAYKWTRAYYPSTNAKRAWFNVLAVIAKLMTPLIRKYGKSKTFNDMIVYNVARGGVGRSTYARHVLVPLLGGEDADMKMDFYIAGALGSDKQLRNLVDLNRMPLILDEQTLDALKKNVPNILAVTVGFAKIGIHASRYGHGIGAKFWNLRGIIIFTNVQFSTFLREVLHEASDFAIVRRFVVVPWDDTPLDLRAFKNIPQIKPAIGFVVRLWKKYRDAFLESSDLLDLMEKLSVAIAREISLENEKLAKEIYDFSMESIKEIREINEEQKVEVKDPINELINNAYDFVINQLNVSNPTAIRVLRYILENPHQAGAVFASARDRQKAEKLLRELDEAIHQLVYMYNIVEDNKGPTGPDPDAVIAYSILKNLYEDRKVYIVLLANGALVRGMPRTFLGVEKDKVSVGGKIKRGYYIPLGFFVKIFLNKISEDMINEEQNEETKETETPTKQPSETENPLLDKQQQINS